MVEAHSVFRAEMLNITFDLPPRFFSLPGFFGEHFAIELDVRLQRPKLQGFVTKNTRTLFASLLQHLEVGHAGLILVEVDVASSQLFVVVCDDGVAEETGNVVELAGALRTRNPRFVRSGPENVK
jgi:hypothetical protein